MINDYYEVFKNINDYLKNSTQNDNNAFINQKEVFSYLIALRNKMYDNYNQNKSIHILCTLLSY